MRLLKHINESSSKTSLLELAQMIYKHSSVFLKDMKNTGNATQMYSGRQRRRRDDWFIRDIRKNRSPMDTPQEVQEVLDDAFYKKFRYRPRSESIFVTGSMDTATSYGRDVYMIFPMGKYQFLYNRTIKDLWTYIENSVSVQYIETGRADVSEWELQNWMDEAQAEAADEYEDKTPIPEPEDHEDEDGILDETSFSIAMNKWDNDREYYIEDYVDSAIDAKRQDHADEYEDDTRIYIDGIVNGYTNKDLSMGIDFGVEIMLSAKRYLAIRYKPYNKYLYQFMNWYDWKKKPEVEDMRLFMKQKRFNTAELNFGV